MLMREQATRQTTSKAWYFSMIEYNAYDPNGWSSHIGRLFFQAIAEPHASLLFPMPRFKTWSLRTASTSLAWLTRMIRLVRKMPSKNNPSQSQWHSSRCQERTSLMQAVHTGSWVIKTSEVIAGTRQILLGDLWIDVHKMSSRAKR